MSEKEYATLVALIKNPKTKKNPPAKKQSTGIQEKSAAVAKEKGTRAVPWQALSVAVLGLVLLTAFWAFHWRKKADTK